ncbi:MAG TPA: hypothetical protein GXX34_10510 [Clostridia bacterium]|nr:hypothetical protein [Clostridia bacterium]
MKVVTLLLVGCLLFLTVVVPEAGAVTPAELTDYRRTAAALHDSQQISDAAYQIFTTAVEIYLAHEAGLFAGEEIAALVTASLGLEKQDWPRRGDTAGKALSLFASLYHDYALVNDLLAASELWAPNKRELELLLLARQLLDRVGTKEDSDVIRLGNIWEGIANSYREEKLGAMPSNQPLPQWESLSEEEARQMFVAYARWVTVNYKWMLLARDRYRDMNWPFLEGEGLLVNWEEYSPEQDWTYGWELLLVPLGLALCVPLVWLGRRSKHPSRQQCGK